MPVPCNKRLYPPFNSEVALPLSRLNRDFPATLKQFSLAAKKAFLNHSQAIDFLMAFNASFTDPEPGDIISLRKIAYTGFWIHHGQPWHMSLWLTLGNMEAIIFFIPTIILALIAQERLWIISRWAVNRFHYSAIDTLRSANHLDDDPESSDDHDSSDENTPLRGQQRPKEITFSDAFADLCKLLGSKWRKRVVKRSRWFAFAAFLSLLIPASIGCAIPYYSVWSFFSENLVQSRETESCISSKLSDGVRANRQAQQVTDGSFQACTSPSVAGCDDNYRLNKKPKIDIKPSRYCLFSSELCLEDIEPLQLTHWDISAFEVGVNSRASVTTSHRLTCTPLRHELLLHDFAPDEIDVWMTIANSSIIQERGDDARKLSVILTTHNTPKYSGRQAALQPMDLTVLPLLDENLLALLRP
jgi:hypothetical protein